MIFSKKKLLNEFSIFFWLILVTLLGIIISTIYTTNKEEQSRQIKLSLDNTYLKKTFKEITRNLNPRITISKYTSKSGDTYQSIINNLNIENDEKKILLNSILKEKSLKILKINQKFTFKYDNLFKQKIIEFKIETDKKNEILFIKDIENKKFLTKKIKKIIRKT